MVYNKSGSVRLFFIIFLGTANFYPLEPGSTTLNPTGQDEAVRFKISIRLFK